MVIYRPELERYTSCWLVFVAAGLRLKLLEFHRYLRADGWRRSLSALCGWLTTLIEINNAVLKMFENCFN